MRIVAISDTHGLLPEIEEKGDVLLIAGDTVDLYVQRMYALSEEWYREDFIPWATSLDFEKIVMVGGNHDFWLEQDGDKFKEMIKGTNIIYLENEYTDITIGNDIITIYGTPLCHKFMNWAFMPRDDKQRGIYELTMDDRHIDILLAHDAPYWCSDICWDSSWGHDHIGSNVLRDVVLAKKPDYLIHGHLHSSNHEEEILGSTKVYNVSLLGEDYALHYKPLVFKI